MGGCAGGRRKVSGYTFSVLSKMQTSERIVYWRVADGVGRSRRNPSFIALLPFSGYFLFIEQFVRPRCAFANLRRGCH